MLFNALARDILRLNQDLLRSQEQLSSGKRINRPSDDPGAIKDILNWKRVLSDLGQYKRNIQLASEYLSGSETALSQVNNILGRLQELTLGQLNDSVDPASRETTAQEVEELYRQLISIGNTRLGNRYIFAGLLYDTEPFDSSGNYQGDSKEASLRIGPTITFQYTIPGDKVFKGTGSPEGVDIYQLVKEIKEALETNDRVELEEAYDRLDKAISQISNYLAEIGARMDRLDAQKDMLEEFSTESEVLLAELEDTDISRISVELAIQQTTLEALQLMTAKVLQLNIFNFLP